MKVVDIFKDEDGMVLYIIIIVCVVGFLVIFIVVIVIYCWCWKGRVIKVNLMLLEILDIFIDSGKDFEEKEFKVFGVEVKYFKFSGSVIWFVYSFIELIWSDDKRKCMFLVVFVEIIELVFEEVEELLLSFEVKFFIEIEKYWFD